MKNDILMNFGTFSTQEEAMAVSRAVDVNGKTDWVECSQCRKWRKFPKGMTNFDPKNVFLCVNNTWAVEFATCLAAEEE